MAMRRSTRVRQPPSMAAPLVLSDSDGRMQASDEEMNPPSEGDDDEDEEWQAKPRKKQKTKSKPKKSEPLLKAFTQMPVDVLAQICSHLEPLDLLQLSRVNKSFRGFLSSSPAIWIHARRAVGLPNLAVPFQTEEQYASLLHDHWCMICDRESHDPRLDPFLRKRLCPGCARHQFFSVSSLPLPPSVTRKTVEKAAASSTLLSESGDPYCLKSDGLALVQKLADLSKNRFAAMLTGKSSSDGESLQAFIQRKYDLHAKINEDGKKLHAWIVSRAAERARQRQQESLRKCDQRRRDIEKRLAAEGWDPIDFEASRFSKHHLVFNLKNLTKKEYDEIHDELADRLTAIRNERLRREAEERQKERRDQLRLYRLIQEDTPINDVRLSAASPLIEADLNELRGRLIYALFVRAVAARASAMSYLPPESIADALAARSPETFTVNTSSARFLYVKGPSEVQQRLLKLPATLLTCETCGQTNGAFPDFISHQCSFQGREYSWGSYLKVEARRIAVVWSILSLLVHREDQVAGVQELDDAGVAFVCRKCEEDNPGGSLKYSWRWMIEHILDTHQSPWNAAIPQIRMIKS